MELTNKVALVTGSTSGIGRAIAEELLSAGAKVVIHGRDVERGRALERELSQGGGNVVFFGGDIALEETNELLVTKAIEVFGRLDIVVANAGMLGLGNVLDVDRSLWNKTFDVNVNAVFYLLRFAIPAMRKNGGGTIVVNSSIAAFKSFPNHAAYCASKAAVVALTKQVSLDFSPEIRANVICPGPVDTPFIWDSAIAFPDPAMAVHQAGQKTAMKRLGLPSDIAGLVLFLVSERSSWMTGSVITIDGGVTIN
jgi:NAD(P)-dependent dehydrogenase (short-subunit alcohol dehydrogenase family)